MKRILIVNNNMHIGGVQKALLNLLQALHADYDITLLLFYRGGALLNEVPSDVRVCAADGAFRYFGMTKNDVSTVRDRLLRTFWAGMTRVLGMPISTRLACLLQTRIQGFDVAISFLHSGAAHTFYGGCNAFVLNCVDAKKKITYLHCDYGHIRAASAYNADLYQRFDEIVACSDGCRRAFLNAHPQLTGKTCVIPNFQNDAAIVRLAKAQPVNLDHGRLNVLTVARFGREKGILRALHAVAALGALRGGLSCYLIGDGLEYAEAQKTITELGLDGTVILLGAMENPYGYMRAADVLLIPSFSEAAPMVIHEAALLGTPILTTETSSAVEMVQDTGFGWVCPNTQEGITQGLRRLLDEPQMLQTQREALDGVTFDVTEARRKFSELINGYDEDTT